MSGLVCHLAAPPPTLHNLSNKTHRDWHFSDDLHTFYERFSNIENICLVHSAAVQMLDIAWDFLQGLRLNNTMWREKPFNTMPALYWGAVYRLSVLSAQSQLLLQSPIINLDWAGSQLAVRGGPDIAIISGLIHRILASFISGRAASFWPGLSCELQMNYVIMDLLGCSPMSGSRPPPLYSFLLSQLRWRERERGLLLLCKHREASHHWALYDCHLASCLSATQSSYYFATQNTAILYNHIILYHKLL